MYSYGRKQTKTMRVEFHSHPKSFKNKTENNDILDQINSESSSQVDGHCRMLFEQKENSQEGKLENTE